MAKLMNTTLGDVLLSPVLKDPASAGRIIADAIAQAEAPVVATKAAEVKVESKPQAQAEQVPEARAVTAPDSPLKDAK